MDTFYTLSECAKLTGISRKTLRRLEREKIFPQGGRIGGRGRYYHSFLVNNWIELRREDILSSCKKKRLENLSLFSLKNYQRIISFFLIDGYGIKDINHIDNFILEISPLTVPCGISAETLRALSEKSLMKNRDMFDASKDFS